MDAANSAATYKMQQVMTASPEELTLMLYNGAIRFVTESMLALEARDFEKSHNTNIKTQKIVREFMATLDMDYEISHNWMQLYDYIEYCLVQGNLKKDAGKLKEAKDMLVQLRDTWYQAMKKAREEKAMMKSS
ncbi:hypothetical protein P22_0497 [Propionispora sp. 2/2-37]|uniref:flagellar export chaperone FliS n=1 Tax=Propionispora sp. 2/2-37 TaxID=1677858 RepID=UPI0006BB87BF|nr:flagellar export chaperone FliS [Propionispora sp. 2/2-37]CUH94431.1 hypothetical protein P22_0497 [Propionispora sp. 2/2-37]